jgi:hypothetical protein
MMRMPSWSRKPAVRGVIWAVIVPVVGNAFFYVGLRYLTDYLFTGPRFYSTISISSVYVGYVLLLPGTLILMPFREPGHLDHYSWVVPVLAALVYFPVFFFFFRWRARRKAARESAAAQGTSPNVA